MKNSFYSILKTLFLVKTLMKRLRVISKLMTSKTEKQIIRIYIFPNNSKIKAIRQEIWTVMRIM